MKKCGFGVPEDKIGTDACAGCHFILVDDVCSWTEEDGIRELDGPTSHPEPLQTSDETGEE